MFRTALSWHSTPFTTTSRHNRGCRTRIAPTFSWPRYYLHARQEYTSPLFNPLKSVQSAASFLSAFPQTSQTLKEQRIPRISTTSKTAKISKKHTFPEIFAVCFLLFFLAPLRAAGNNAGRRFRFDGITLGYEARRDRLRFEFHNPVTSRRRAGLPGQGLRILFACRFAFRNRETSCRGLCGLRRRLELRFVERGEARVSCARLAPELESAPR